MIYLAETEIHHGASGRVLNWWSGGWRFNIAKVSELVVFGVKAVLRIHDIWCESGSAALTNGPGSGSPYFHHSPSSGQQNTNFSSYYFLKVHFNYLCTYDLYSPGHNVVDACISITRGSGWGLALEFESFLGPVKWH